MRPCWISRAVSKLVLLPSSGVSLRFLLRSSTVRVHSLRKKLAFLAGRAKLLNLETALSLALCALALFALQRCCVLNTSPSLPVGLYLKTYMQPNPGDLVLVCPPDLPIFREAVQRAFLSPGLCPAGSGYLIKQLAAASGDDVVITAHGVRVNGVLLPDSTRKNFLRQGQNLNRKLAAKEVLLMAPHPMSFDGRYFGLLDQNTIITSLRPLWVWEHT